jgi:hypothetical protein
MSKQKVKNKKGNHRLHSQKQIKIQNSVQVIIINNHKKVLIKNLF